MAGDVFGPYRLDELLGRGGMGEVWRARDTRKDRVVAVKVLGSSLAADPEFRDRFSHESAVASRLNSPNIVPIHDYGDIGGTLFIEMPLIAGVDLAAMIGHHGPLPPERAVAIVAQVGRALSAAHRAGLVHRDVKPSNVLVTDAEGHDHAYLIDFGIARNVENSRTSVAGSVIGSPAYMSPERFDGRGDHRGDVYALGCVLYEALTRYPPYPGSSPMVLMKSHLWERPPRPSAARPGLPVAFDDVVARALAKDPDRRYQSVSDLVGAARAALTVPRPPGEVRHAPPGGHGRAAAPAPGRAAGVPGPAATTLVPAGRPPDPVTAGPTAPARAPVPRFDRPVPPGPPPQGSSRRRRRVAGISVTAALLCVVGLLVAFVTLGPPGPAPATRPDLALTGHTDSVTGVAAARLDGRPVVVSAGVDRSVIVWDPATGAPVGKPITGHTDAVYAVATAQLDGRPVVVSAGADRTVRVWDLATHDPVGRPITGHTDSVDALATARLGGRPVVVSGSADRTARAWDLATGAPIGSPATGHTGAVYAVATSELDGEPVMVTGSDDRTLRVWDLAGGEPVGRPLTGHAGAVFGLATTQLDGDPVVVSGSADRSVRVWDLATGEPVGTPLTGTDYVASVATAEIDGQPVLVSGGGDRTVRVRQPTGT